MAVFDTRIVHKCAMECLGHPVPEMFDVFADAMEREYPGRIDKGQPWLYSIAGGAMIQMTLYYASPFEYIMIWGTPIGSEGHSGRHFTGFWDTVIDGEMWYYAEGEFHKTVYKPGDRVYVGPGQARAMNFTTGVYAVEYARGFLPAEIFFGIISEILICTDLIAAFQTLTLYVDLSCQWLGHTQWLLRPFTSIVSKIFKKITWALCATPEVGIPENRNTRWFQRKGIGRI
jgi:C-8 sterol isomerase